MTNEQDELQYFIKAQRVFSQLVIHRRQRFEQQISAKRNLDKSLQSHKNSSERKELVKRILEVIGSEYQNPSSAKDHHLIGSAQRNYHMYVKGAEYLKRFKEQMERDSSVDRKVIKEFAKSYNTLLREMDKGKQYFTELIETLKKQREKLTANDIKFEAYFTLHTKEIKFENDINSKLRRDVSKADAKGARFIKSFLQGVKQDSTASEGTTTAILIFGVVLSIASSLMLFTSNSIDIQASLNESLLSGAFVFTGINAVAIKKSPLYIVFANFFKNMKTLV